MKKLKKIFLFLLVLMPLTSLGQNAKNDFEELAQGYYNQGKLTQAAEFFSKSGYAYWNKGESKKAAEMFQKSYDLFSSQSNSYAAFTVSNNLGIIYLDNEKYSNAYTAFSNALTYARKLKNTQEIFNSLINVGSVAIELGTYTDAVAKANEALLLAKESSSLKALAKCYSLLAESYEKMGDDSNAYKYYEMYSTIDKKIKAQEMDDLKNMSAEEISKAHEKKRITEIELKIKTGELKLTQDSLAVAERIAYERQMQIDLKNARLRESEVQLRYERHIKKTLILGIIIIALFLFILGYLLSQKLKDNKTLKMQKEEITNQRNKLDTQNKKITDSIHYGLRIQQAMLPSDHKFEDSFETFIIYKPKDIVSGDFYWFYQIQKDNYHYKFAAVIDCTGHGVPGAFMSMIGHRMLTDVVVENKIYQPSSILTEIHERLKNELNTENRKTMDGMDIALCRFDLINGKCDSLIFAGAKRQLLIFNKDKNDVEIIDGDHKSIGGLLTKEAKLFRDQKINIRKNDLLIMFSDGIIDQQNSERNRYGTNRFTSVIAKNLDQPMSFIKQALENDFNNFKRDEEQRDDITVLGIKII